ncbi:MAG: hypothetical protein ACMXX5_01215 [Candidatus Woesearchaeota archaeon]
MIPLIRLKKRYLSSHPCTGKLNIDRYNIDFIRYFRFYNFILALAGSMIGLVLFLLNNAIARWSVMVKINTLYLIVFFAGAGFFAFTSLIVYFAGNSKFESCRLASRRGLFTFSVMLAATLISLVISGRTSWNQQFYYFIKYLLLGMIFAGLFAVPMDYGISFLKGLKKKRKLDSL